MIAEIGGTSGEELPEGWALTSLGNIIRPSGEKVEPAARPDAPYLSLEHIEANTSRILRRGTGSDVRSTKSVFRAGDVLYGKLRPYLNKVCIPDFDGICSTDILVFPASRHVDPRYLLRFLTRNEVVEFAHHSSTGVELPRTSFEKLAGFEIPLPPLAEQQRIVAAVEAVLQRVDAARERLARVPQTLKRFRQQVLAGACSGALTADWRDSGAQVTPGPSAIAQLASRNGCRRVRRGVPLEVPMGSPVGGIELPDTWAKESVARLLHCGALLDVKDGNHGTNHPTSSEFTQTGVPFVMASHVHGYTVHYDEAPRISGAPLDRIRVGFAEPGDAILTHKGSVGRAALNVQHCVLTPQTTYYRCDPSVLDSSFLVYFFTSRQFYDQVSAVMGQTTRDYAPVSEQYRLFLFIPPIEEQHEIVRRVEGLFALAERVEQRVAAARARADRLTQAILSRAFRGELVPTEAELARRDGREYEPASVLLARIRGERLAQGSAAGRGKRSQ